MAADHVEKGFAIACELGLADAVNRGERRCVGRLHARHLDESAVREDHVSGYALRAREAEALLLECIEQ